MPRVQRKSLLGVLELLTPGLSSREMIAQGSCIVFVDGKVVTFNEEILASIKSPLPSISGAVKAKPLLDILSKLSDDDVEVEQKSGELSVKGKGRRCGIRMEEEVMLPVESVEIPGAWRSLDKEFCEAIEIVHSCASAEESRFVLTCVHIHPEFVEACDRFQIARYPVITGVSASILVRAESIRRISGYAMSEVSETESWIHFRNSSGLTLSFRRFLDEYVNLNEFLSSDGVEPFTLPGSIEEIVGRAEVFSGDNAVGNNIAVDINNEFIQIEGEGAFGWYKERRQVKFVGRPIRFLISPKLLVNIVKKSSECGVGGGKLFVDTGKFKFAACTVVPEVKKGTPVLKEPVDGGIPF